MLLIPVRVASPHPALIILVVILPIQQTKHALVKLHIKVVCIELVMIVMYGLGSLVQPTLSIVYNPILS
ncbi:hypothetical protein COT07_04245 [Candidatus Woesearchaeota archaeon CG07_land_8_20_14_0_80_44_23]|nr:MAG: hypothetical protein COT07_04245 [Candidatus Woesearchaeota archaeon CG07_land_8_20_14_0_80_44_23]